MNSKLKYRELCRNDHSIPLFSKDWWLDTVCGDDKWDVSIVEKDNRIVSSLPYYIKHKSGFTLLEMPPLTQSLGPWIKFPTNQKPAKRFQFEKKMLNALIDELPRYDYFHQNFHYSLQNWLPFHWSNFEQSTRYTYILDDLTDTDKLWKNLQSNIKSDIKKAESRFNLHIESSEDIDLFYKINCKTFQKQNISIPYTEQFIRNLDDACKKNSCRLILFAKDSDDRVYSTVYIVWDENSAYYLMGGNNPNLPNSGANSLLLWHAIKHVSAFTNRFNFEGSMIEPIERFFRAFGANQQPYFSISKNQSKLLFTLLTLKENLNMLRGH